MNSQTNPWTFVLASLLLSGAVYLLHGQALNAWWRWDDPVHLSFVVQHTPWEYFFVPQVWQSVSPVNFTPWLSLSYQTDLQLFGLRPAAFYAHQLASLWLASVMTYALLLGWVRPLWAFAGALLFLAGAPVAVVAEQLMTRHYVDGLAFALAATILAVQASRRERPSLAWAGAVLYLLAVLSKEIYAPLVLLLPLLMQGTLRVRARLLLPFMLIAALYTIWRLYMLGMEAGGYTPFDSFDPWSSLRQLAAIPVLLFGSERLGLLTAALLGALLLVSVGLRPRRVLVALTVLVLILLPLLPVTIWPGLVGHDRFLFLPWWVLSVATAWIADRFARSVERPLVSLPAGLGLAALVFVSVHQHAVEMRDRMGPVFVEKETQGRFLWNADASEVAYLSPLVAAMFWDYGKLLELRPLVRNGERGPAAIADESQLLDLHQEGTRVWSYDPACRCMVEISDEVPARLERWRQRLRNQPLTVAANSHRHTLSWRFGPYTDGIYSVVAPELTRISLPPQGSHRSSIHFDQARVRYDSPEGWITYSPILRMTPRGIVPDDPEPPPGLHGNAD